MSSGMHPRNIFQTPPDFKMLALLYPEFKQHVKLDAAGNARFNFKDPGALRIFSTILLKHFFALDVIIPIDTLVPTIPLRLNYVLWLQDVADYLKLKNEEVSVLDIGTGASCIYPLLMVNLRNWKVMAIDTCDRSIATAKENIKRNNMEGNIEVEHIESDKIISDVKSLNDRQYVFCMCNPPFFNSLDKNKNKNRNNRPPPNNALSGSPNELSTPGGEVVFIQKMIEESAVLKNKIRVYSTMVGHKSSIFQLLAIFKKMEINNVLQTTFIQGITSRWAIAWTFDDSIDLLQGPSASFTKKNSQKELKMTYLVENVDDVPSLQKEIENVLLELKTNYELVYLNKELCEFKVKAKQDTWSHSRRRRREEARKRSFEDTLRSLSLEVDNLKNSINYVHCNRTYDNIETDFVRIRKLIQMLCDNKYAIQQHTELSNITDVFKDHLEKIKSCENVKDIRANRCNNCKKVLDTSQNTNPEDKTVRDIIQQYLHNMENIIGRLNSALNSNVNENSPSTSKSCLNEVSDEVTTSQIDKEPNSSLHKRPCETEVSSTSKKLKSDHTETSDDPKQLSGDNRENVEECLIELSIILNKKPNNAIKLIFIQTNGIKNENVLCTFFNYVINTIKKNRKC